MQDHDLAGRAHQYQGEAGREYHEHVHRLPGHAGDWIARARARKFEPYVGSEDNVVEYGIGPGWNLIHLNCRAKIGIDLAESLGAALLASGIAFTTEASSVEADTADVVICHHMLEHVDSPADTLHEIRRVLKPGGLLLLYVPYEQRRRTKRYDPQEPNQHLYSWNVQTMGALTASQGFDVLEAGLRPSGYDRVAATASARLHLGYLGFRVVRGLMRAVKPVREVYVIARQPRLVWAR